MFNNFKFNSFKWSRFVNCLPYNKSAVLLLPVTVRATTWLILSKFHHFSICVNDILIFSPLSFLKNFQPLSPAFYFSNFNFFSVCLLFFPSSPKESLFNLDRIPSRYHLKYLLLLNCLFCWFFLVVGIK